MKILKDSIERAIIDNDPSRMVFRFSKDEGHTKSFGYEWTKYSRTYSDAQLGVAVSMAHMEAVLGFPAEFLKGMNVIEIGCGAGRFTEIFADYTKHVVATDLSRAVYVNAAMGRPNVTLIQADLLDIPELSEPIDLVFCRGVIQHTVNPHQSLKRIFDYCRPGGLVIFDVYKKYWWDKFNFKYFWRPFFKRLVPMEKFDQFINRHDEFLYKTHHAYLKIVARIPIFRVIIGKTPFYFGVNWEKQYKHLTHKQRLEIFKNELVDTFYAEYDQPMTRNEIIYTLAEIGQIPYSHDVFRNYFRYKKSENSKQIRVQITKNGIFQI